MKTLVFLLAALSLASANGQPYPSKPVHLIVGLPAGGGADAIARLIAAKLGDGWGQPVVVENRPGSGGLIAAAAVAKAAPDGYTLLFASTSTQAIFPALYKKLPYDPLRDFVPVSLLATLPNVLLVSPALPATTLAEFIAYAKQHPGKLSYASAGTGTVLHLSMEMLKAAAGIDLVHVPYKGGVQAMPDLLTGQIQAMFEILPTELGNIKAGKVRALAVTGEKRSARLPEVPTMIEAGFPGFEVTVWFALFAPAGTPPSVIEKLNGHAGKALDSEDLKRRLAQQGVDASASSAEWLGEYQRAEIAKWAGIVHRSGASID